MEWLFGRKKSEAKVEEAKDTVLMVDDFVMCPPVHDVPPAGGGGYPSLPDYYHPPGGAARPAAYTVPPTDQHKRQVNPLDSIPFRLSSKLSSDGASTALSADIRRIGSYLSQVRRSLDSAELDYDFKLEQCVLRETNAFNGL